MNTAEQLRARLRARYREPQRHYHTEQHVEELLALAQELRDQIAHPERMSWAIWYHDAIYDPQRSDNEARSAELARQELAQLCSSEVAHVVRMVEATVGHRWNDGEADTALFLDLDLSILGAAPARYDEYVRQVRAEYAFVPEPVFVEKRSALLKAWLARSALYFTELGRARWQATARANLTRELAR